ncbi:Serine/threonine-protein kinase-like protein acr4, partial [Dionaea muscipula]
MGASLSASLLKWVFNLKARFVAQILILVVVISSFLWLASGLGSMTSIAISYGENGPVFCGLKSDGSHLVTCYGQNPAIIYGTPSHFPFVGLTGGDGFVCGILMESSLPYCWGSSGFITMGVPQPMAEGAQYLEISAGDNHLCGLRKPLMGRFRNTSLVDCWGYNMTSKHVFDGQIKSISAGSEFSCGLFAENRTAFCWGDETSSNVISLIPKGMRFQLIAAGGYHACGIVEGVESRIFCWGSLNGKEEEELATGYTGEGDGNVDLPPKDPMLTVVGGKFHACGIKSYDRGVTCWGHWMEQSTPPPGGRKFYGIAAGDYFSCGILADKSLQPICWGYGFPKSLPLAVSPGLCESRPCLPGFVEHSHSCKDPNSHICVPCQKSSCPPPYEAHCAAASDEHGPCAYNCSSCSSPGCSSSNCSSSSTSDPNARPRNKSSAFWAVQLPIIIAEAAFAAFLAGAASLIVVLYVRFRLRNCRCLKKMSRCQKNGVNGSSPKVRPELEELKVRRAQMFAYEELERATGGFKEESLVGKGSFSCVFKGVLKDGTVVAVKRAIMSLDMKKSSKEFRTELDLLSRLNHAHLLNLLGYCEEGGERLLVYEFMAHGSLHQHLHAKNKVVLKEQLDWVRRVTIAVQAARGIEYLHGYACPPVIHRDIKSSNILIDEEHNARVADFGLSLLGPANSSSPLAELPAGTLGYLDPEYYRLHYLTTKSDVYSFGVLLLEILSGRKAIDMQYEEGNIVEWAVPLIKSGDIPAILDPILKPPPEIEALKRIANVACKCVRMRGKDRPSMDK